MPATYWMARFTLLDRQFQEVEDRAAEDSGGSEAKNPKRLKNFLIDEQSVERIFLHLDEFCITDEAKQSLKVCLIRLSCSFYFISSPWGVFVTSSSSGNLPFASRGLSFPFLTVEAVFEAIMSKEELSRGLKYSPRAMFGNAGFQRTL